MFTTNTSKELNSQSVKEAHKVALKRAKFFHKISERPHNANNPMYQARDVKKLLSAEHVGNAFGKGNEVTTKGAQLFRGNVKVIL